MTVLFYPTTDSHGLPYTLQRDMILTGVVTGGNAFVSADPNFDPASISTDTVDDQLIAVAVNTYLPMNVRVPAQTIYVAGGATSALFFDEVPES